MYKYLNMAGASVMSASKMLRDFGVTEIGVLAWDTMGKKATYQSAPMRTCASRFAKEGRVNDVPIDEIPRWIEWS